MPCRTFVPSGYVEAHILEADLAGDPGCVDRIRRVDGLRQRREHRPDALRAGDGPLQPAGRMRDLGQRAVHGAEIGDDHRQLAQAHAALQHVRAADHDDERRPQNRDHADDDREQRLLPGDGDARGHHLGAEPRVPIRLESLARETLDEPNGREHLVQPLDELRLELLDTFGSRHQRAHVITEAEVEKRHHRERQQRNRQVQRRQNREHHDERDHRGGKREQPAHHEVLDRVRVDVDAVHRVARVRGDVMVQAEGLNLLEEPAPSSYTMRCPVSTCSWVA